MKLKNLLSVLYFLGFVGVLGIFYSFSTRAISNFSSDNQPQWQNLKVLPQDISKDSLFHLMDVYSMSLGVKCSYCHIPREDDPKKLDFADDSKLAKHYTRAMIEMTDKINEDFFKPYYEDPKPDKVADVSCVMCHRGTAKPKSYLENMGSLFPKKEEDKKE